MKKTPQKYTQAIMKRNQHKYRHTKKIHKPYAHINPQHDHIFHLFFCSDQQILHRQELRTIHDHLGPPLWYFCWGEGGRTTHLRQPNPTPELRHGLASDLLLRQSLGEVPLYGHLRGQDEGHFLRTRMDAGNSSPGKPWRYPRCECPLPHFCFFSHRTVKALVGTESCRYYI